MSKRAASVEYIFCDNPECGLHILSLDGKGRTICETVMSAEGTIELLKYCIAQFQSRKENLN
jgi:hypothetical protein